MYILLALQEAQERQSFNSARVNLYKNLHVKYLWQPIIVLVLQNLHLISSKPHPSLTLIPSHLAGVNSNLRQYTNLSRHSILISFSAHLKNEKV
jgi:hypothetical protein